MCAGTEPVAHGLTTCPRLASDLPLYALAFAFAFACLSIVSVSAMSGALHIQLRIHDSEGVDFYVLVASGPIIEDCCGLRFAPTGLRYPQYQHHLQVYLYKSM